jgi:hypothetical protein
LSHAASISAGDTEREKAGLAAVVTDAAQPAIGRARALPLLPCRPSPLVPEA